MIFSGNTHAAITFDDTDDLINCGLMGDAVMTENGALTISLWMNQTSATTGALVVRGNSSNNRVVFETQATRALRFQVAGTTTLTRTTNTSAFSDATWTHVLLTWDGSTTAANAHIYVNGVEATYATTTNGGGIFNNNTYPLVIGSRNTGTNFGGNLTEIAVFNKVVNASEIAQLYGGGSVPKGLPSSIDRSSLKGYWKMDEDTSGTVPSVANPVKDWSNGKNDGKQSGNPVYASEPSNLPYRSFLFGSTIYSSTIY